MTARVWLAAAAEEAMRTEARRHTDAETGGMLLGYWRDGDAVVVEIIGPGPAATRSRSAFHPDARWQQAQLDSAYRSSGRRHTYLGDWHVHPGGTTRPSRTDRRTLAAIASHGPARAPRPLFAIIAPDDAGPIDIWCHAGRWRRPQALTLTAYG